MVLIFESDWTEFSVDAFTPVELTYSSSGLSTSRIEFLGKDGDEYGFPPQYDLYGNEILKPYFINSINETILVYKPENYVFSGQFKVSIYD